MIFERKKKAIILTLALSAFVIDAVMLLGGLIIRCPILSIFGDFLIAVGFRVWGWAPALGLGITAIICSIRWKPSNLRLCLFVRFISIIAVIFALLWACVSYVALTLNP